MAKYHDQEIINERVAEIRQKAIHEQQRIITTLKDLRATAKYEVNKITIYTSPEDYKQRHNILNYYEDMIERLEE